MKERIQYDEQFFHITVAGVTGSKSSLINALRGLHNNSPGSAPTSVTETTLEVKRYPSVNSQPIAWYDIPGAATPSVTSWQYPGPVRLRLHHRPDERPLHGDGCRDP